MIAVWPDSRIIFMSFRHRKWPSLDRVEFSSLWLRLSRRRFVRDFPIKLAANLSICYLLLTVVINQNANFETKSV